MVIRRFPPITLSDEQGLLAVGGDLEVPSLLLAYRSGIFPWPLPDGTLAWFSPPQRAILRLEDFHLSRSLRQARRQADYIYAVDRDFEGVIGCCAEIKNRGTQQGTWITPAMIGAYHDLHQAGWAHSVECYQGGQLIGGLYGVAIGGFFSGESMFYRAPNGSKLALLYLVEQLQAQNVLWIDCQVMTPHLARLGATEIPRAQYLNLLANALRAPTPPLFQTGLVRGSES